MRDRDKHPIDSINNNLLSDATFNDVISELIINKFNKQPEDLILERKPKADKGV